MSEEFLRWLLGGIAGALAIGYTRLWFKMWSKDEEVDKVRAEGQAKLDAVVKARDEERLKTQARIDELVRENYALQIGFEKQHGATVRKALSIVMAAKHKREPREPKAGRDVTTQMKMLTQELSGVEVDVLLESLRGG